VIKELGAKADPAKDDIRVSGSQIGQPSAPVYIALHKPAGYITTASDEHGRATVGPRRRHTAPPARPAHR